MTRSSRSTPVTAGRRDAARLDEVTRRRGNLPGLHVLVIDDGSGDDTLAHWRLVAATHDRLKLKSAVAAPGGVRGWGGA
jgi:hypothetical protein